MSRVLEVRGLSTLDDALRKLPEAVRREVLESALRDAGDIIRAGVADRIRNASGRTAQDLVVAVTVKGSGGVVSVGGTGGKGGRAHVLKYLEFGTAPHVIPKGGRRGKERTVLTFGGRVVARVQHPGIAAQAPLRRSLDEDGPRAVQVFAQRLWDGIRAVAERVKGGAR